MKITDSDIIKNGEQELIDAITADLDWGAIEDIFLKEHNLGIDEDIEYKSGDIVAVDNRIAYKLEFEVKVNLSVLLDRNGDYLSVNIYNKKDTPLKEEDTELLITTEEQTDDSIIHETREPDYIEVIEKDTDTGETEAAELIVFQEEEQKEEKTAEAAADENRETHENIESSGIFKDLTDNESDDMGNMIDDIVENIKKAS